jgi:hypothetical protein
MLLGCCHCGEEPPSESIPPSESTPSESQSEESIETVLCGLCGEGYGLAPRFLQLTFAYSGSTGLCCAEYNKGSFSLEYDSNLILGIGQACGGWRTLEGAKQVGGTPQRCNNIFGNPPLAAFFFTQDFGGNNKRANARVSFQSVTATYQTSVALNADQTFDCIAGFSLDRVANPATVPCTGVAWPATVSVSPL